MRKIALFASVATLALAMPVSKPVAYDNVLTGLIPDIYAAIDVVSRELVGFLPGIARSATQDRVAVGQATTYWITPVPTAVDITPAMTVPTPAAQTMETGSIVINKSRAVPFGFTGEEAKGLNTGVGILTLQGDMIAQALRVLVNEMEADLAAEAYKHAARAYGTAGTTPFATNLGDSAQVRKILDDNGAPLTERSLVLNTTAGAALRTLAQLTKVNESGTTMTLRDGVLLDLHGFATRESAQIKAHTKGTGASATTNAAGYAIGATVITLASAGTGTIVAGDVITFAGDTNKYVVVSGDADTSDGGTITLAKPGLRVAIAAGATAITVGASYTANVAFARNALVLAARAPAIPPGGDLARDRMMFTDPRSGISFEFAVYPGYHMNAYEVSAAWGVKATKEEHIAMLLG